MFVIRTCQGDHRRGHRDIRGLQVVPKRISVLSEAVRAHGSLSKSSW